MNAHLAKAGSVRIPLSVVVGITVIIAMEIIGVSTAVIVGRDAGQIITFLAIINGAGVPGVIAISKAETTERRVEAVNEKVNGHLSRLTDMAVEAGQLPSDGKRDA